MSASEKARQIRERRTIEAIRKNMVGASGKLGVIAKYLGFPILQQQTETRYFLEDTYETQEDEIETAEAGAYCIGYCFDGLSRGIHFEVKYDANYSQLKAYYKGYLVFEEVAGDLYTYSPFEEWEDIVNKLYKNAQEVAQRKEEESKKLRKDEMAKKWQKLYQDLKMRWGL